VNGKIKGRGAIPDLRNSDGSIINESLDKANAFNEFFSSVFTTENTSELPKLPNKVVKQATAIWSQFYVHWMYWSFYKAWSRINRWDQTLYILLCLKNVLVNLHILCFACLENLWMKVLFRRIGKVATWLQSTRKVPELVLIIIILWVWRQQYVKKAIIGSHVW